MNDLSKELSHELGDSPQITAVTIPSGLDYIAEDYIYEILLDSDSIPQITRPGHILSYLDATRSAYDMDSAEGPGPKVPKNPFHEDDFLVLHIDLNAYSLDIWVATIAEYIASLLENGPFSLRRSDLGVFDQNHNNSKVRLAP